MAYVCSTFSQHDTYLSGGNRRSGGFLRLFRLPVSDATGANRGLQNGRRGGEPRRPKNTRKHTEMEPRRPKNTRNHEEMEFSRPKNRRKHRVMEPRRPQKGLKPLVIIFLFYLGPQKVQAGPIRTIFAKFVKLCIWVYCSWNNLFGNLVCILVLLFLENDFVSFFL